MKTKQPIELLPIWTVTANIVYERKFGPGGNETKIGTKHFKPGTRVFIIDWYPGVCNNIIVVGIARKPRRYIRIVISVDWVENLRIKLCHHPAALNKIYSYFIESDESIERLTKEFAEGMFKAIPNWQKQPKNDTLQIDTIVLDF